MVKDFNKTIQCFAHNIVKLSMVNGKYPPLRQLLLHWFLIFSISNHHSNKPLSLMTDEKMDDSSLSEQGRKLGNPG